MSRYAVAALAAAGLLVAAIQPARACGLNWSEPKSHFDGVSFQGYVFLVETLGEIELRDGKKLPVHAIFRSESNSTSPYLGHGWELPILESHIVQLDERWFRVVEPTGWNRIFWRDEKDPNVLHGQGNWKGVIQRNSISVMADCGDRLNFRDGRLISMQIGDEKLDIARSPDGTASLRQGGIPLLTTQKSLSKEAGSLKFGTGNLVELDYADRPLIEIIGGQAVVQQQVKSLANANPATGSIARNDRNVPLQFSYGVDQGLNPTINMVHLAKAFVWHPESKQIISDLHGSYSIKMGDDRFGFASITRINREGGIDEFQPEIAGTQTNRYASGLTRRIRRFVSGSLAGKIRDIVDSKNSTELRKRKWVYNEKGEVVRVEDSASGNSKLQRDLGSLFKEISKNL